MDPEVVAAVLDDWETAPVSDRLRAGLACAFAQTGQPPEISAADLESWRAAGLDDEAIEDVVNITLHFNIINRVADAFDFPLSDEKTRSRHIRFLNRMGNIQRARRPNPSLSAASEGIVRPVEVTAGRDRILTVSGVTESSTRQAIEAYTAGLAGGRRPAAVPPAALLPYLDKLTRHPYRIVDEDIDALRAAGFDDEAIFEITLAAGLGAALPPLERVCELCVLFRREIQRRHLLPITHKKGGSNQRGNGAG